MINLVCTYYVIDFVFNMVSVGAEKNEYLEYFNIV